MTLLKPVVAAALCALGAVLPAHAVIYTYTGSTAGGPTFNRPVEDGSGLSAVGTAVSYSSFEFTVSLSGEYTFLTTAPGYDPFVLLYSPSFSPAAALGNFVAGNDDLLGFTTSGVSASLSAGMSYVFVNTGFGNTDFGSFSTTIGGPGAVTPVPEPEVAAMLAVGLLMVSLARRRQA
jgi:hypothetical protein